MATLTSVNNKAAKISTVKHDGFRYSIELNGYTLSWAKNGRSEEATNFYTKRVSEKDEAGSDYFAGVFHDNFTRALKFLQTK